MARNGGGTKRPTSTTRRRFLGTTGALAATNLSPGFSGDSHGARLGTSASVNQGENPVRIGASLPYTGFMAEEGAEMFLGMDFWRQEVEAAGGLLDRPVEFVIYDDRSTPEGAKAAYQRLLEDDDVDLVMGTAGTLATAGAIDVLESKGVPCVFPMSWGTRAWTIDRSWCVPLLPIATEASQGLVEVLADLDLETFGIIRSSSGYARDFVEGLVHFLDDAGIDILDQVTYSRNDSAARRAALRQIAGSNADVIGGGGSVAEVKPLIRAIADMGIEAKAFAWSDFDDNRVLPLAESAEGMLGVGFWTARAGFPGNAEFVRRFSDWAAVRKADWSRVRLLQHHSPAAYAGARVLQRAVEEAGTFDPEPVRDALWNLDMPTVYGRFKVDEQGYQVGKRMLVLQYQRQLREVVWPPDLRTAEPTLSPIRQPTEA